jgi:hypothetical protein
MRHLGWPQMVISEPCALPRRALVSDGPGTSSDSNDDESIENSISDET